MTDNSESLTWTCPRCGVQWNTPETECLTERCDYERRPEDENAGNRFEQMSDVTKEVVWH